jgi:hypothetical protein
VIDLARVSRGVLVCVEESGRHHRQNRGGDGAAASDLQERESGRVVAAGSDQLLQPKVQVNHDGACDEEGRHRAMRRMQQLQQQMV